MNRGAAFFTVGLQIAAIALAVIESPDILFSVGPIAALLFALAIVSFAVLLTRPVP